MGWGIRSYLFFYRDNGNVDDMVSKKKELNFVFANIYSAALIF